MRRSKYRQTPSCRDSVETGPAPRLRCGSASHNKIPTGQFHGLSHHQSGHRPTLLVDLHSPHHGCRESLASCGPPRAAGASGRLRRHRVVGVDGVAASRHGPPRLTAPSGRSILTPDTARACPGIAARRKRESDTRGWVRRPFRLLGRCMRPIWTHPSVLATTVHGKGRTSDRLRLRAGYRCKGLHHRPAAPLAGPQTLAAGWAESGPFWPSK